MKKLTTFAAAVVMCAAGTAAFAAPGDAAGDYYSTDIVTYLNGCAIGSINIGGDTLISAEDMYYYSFSVEWNAEERTLRIDSVSDAVNGAPPAAEGSGAPAGTVLGKYYETDIVTYLDGEPIRAYNTGGRTYIHAEAMRDMGYEVVWNETDRTLSITSPDRAGHEYYEDIAWQTDDETNTAVYDASMSFEYTPESVTGRGAAAGCNISIGADGGRMYVHLSHTGSSIFPSELFSRMREIAYMGNIPVQYEPEERYADVAAVTKISVNGVESERIAVMQTQGNNHSDYIFFLTDIPVCRFDEIENLTFEFGTPSGESYELLPPRDPN